MENETNVEKRISRAQSEQIKTTVIKQEPLIVHAENESSNSIHTVLPDELHCSCEDHTYRGSICKHLIALADNDDWIAEAVRKALTDRLKELGTQQNELRQALSEIAVERQEITTIRQSLDVVLDYSESHDNDHIDVNEEALQEFADSLQEESEQDDFAEMVDELTDNNSG